jgi:hypothetical protein
MVTDRLEFPSVLDIRECTTGASDSIPYQLKCVVLHSGTADTGIIRQLFKFVGNGLPLMSLVFRRLTTGVSQRRLSAQVLLVQICFSTSKLEQKW